MEQDRRGGQDGAGLVAQAYAHRLQIAVLVGIVAVCTVAVAAQYARWMGGYFTDDAFISFRYARHLADGLGLVWNPGEGPVEGYTNFGWVLLIALGMKAGVDPVDASRALGLLASIGTLALVPVLAAQLRPVWTWRWWLVAGGASLALALNSGFSLWTFAGLETPAHGFFVLAGVTVHLWEERTKARPVWSSPLFLAAALIRPDALVFWGLTALHKATRLLSDERREELPRLALWAALFALPFLAYWLWRWNYFGYFYPNTYYLKTERSLAFFERGWDYARDFFLVYWMWLAVAAGAVSVVRERARVRPATFLLAISTVWFAYVVYSGGDWMPYYRFFIVVLPFVYVLAVHGLIDAADLVAERGMPRAATFAALAVIVALVPFSAIRPHDSDTAKQSARLPTMEHGLPGAVRLEEHRPIGLWLRDTFPPDTSVAQIAAGTVPYFSRLPTFDMLGVNDPHIAHLDIPLGVGPAGHEKTDGAYIVSREPDIIWLMLTFEAAPRTSIELYAPPHWPRGGLPLSDQILDQPDLWRDYEPIAVPFERGGYLNLIVRRDLQLPPEDGLLIPAR